MVIKLPNCLQCKNYYITHDPARPYGCRAMGFKSKANPARVVYGSSGIHCQLFEAKTKSGRGGGTAKKMV